MENRKKVKESFEKKFDIAYGERKLPEKENRQEKDPVKASINKKMDAYITHLGGYNGKDQAAQYIGKPITEIVREQRKAENLLEAAEKEVQDFLDDQYKKILKGFRSGTESMRKELAERFVYDYIIGSLPSGDDEISEAHKKFLELKDAVAAARVKKNALAIAREDFETVHADIIQREKERAVLKDIRESGILKDFQTMREDVKTEENEENEE